MLARRGAVGESGHPRRYDQTKCSHGLVNAKATLSEIYERLMHESIRDLLSLSLKAGALRLVRQDSSALNLLLAVPARECCLSERAMTRISLE